MVLDAVVKDDGTLIAKAPKSLWGKRVRVQIKEERRKTKPQKTITTPDLLSISASQENQESLAQWEAISAIFTEADKLDIPRRTIDEILHDIHEFRGSA